MKDIDQIINDHGIDALPILREKMISAAKDMDFEKAADFRDAILEIERSELLK